MHPETKQIDGQTAVRWDSPHEDWPGCIYVPRELTPQQFDRWWKNTRENPYTEDAPANFVPYENRFFLVLEWHIKGVKDEHLTGKAIDMPSMKPVLLAVGATLSLVREAQQFPLSPRPSNDSANGNEASA